MRVAVLATGGKDSTLALHRVLSSCYDVKCLVSMIPMRPDSWMFHYPNMHLMDLFAEAVGIPLVKAETSGVKEKEVEDLKRLIKALDVDGLVCGAISSSYQKGRVEKVCEELGLKCVMPLWHEKPLDVLREALSLKFEVMITSVCAYGFDEGWLGKTVDEGVVEALIELNKRYGISIVGEGGEYETLVLDAPMFKKRLRVVEAEKVWEGQSGYLLIKSAELEDKPR